MKRWPWYLLLFVCSMTVGILTILIRQKYIGLIDSFLAQSFGAALVVYVVPFMLIRRLQQISVVSLVFPFLVLLGISALMLAGTLGSVARDASEARSSAVQDSVSLIGRSDDDQLAAIAQNLHSQVSPHLPMKIDDMISISRMETTNRSIAIYYVLSASVGNLDPASLAQDGTGKGKAFICGNSETAKFVELGGSVSFHFLDTNHSDIAIVNIDSCR